MTKYVWKDSETNLPTFTKEKLDADTYMYILRSVFSAAKTDIGDDEISSILELVFMKENITYNPFA